LRDDLGKFCREAPPEFTDHQRQVFCVFSGQGVIALRKYLNERPDMFSEVASDDDDTVDGEDGSEAPQTPVQYQHIAGDALQDPNVDGADGDADEELDDENADMFGGGYGAPLH